MTDGDIVLRPVNSNFNKRGPCTLFSPPNILSVTISCNVHDFVEGCEYSGVEYSPGETWTDGCATYECFESGGFGCVCRRDEHRVKRGQYLPCIAGWNQMRLHRSLSPPLSLSLSLSLCVSLSPLSLFVSVSLTVSICLSVCRNLPNNNLILNHNNLGRLHLSLFYLEVLSKDTRTSSISHWLCSLHPKGFV